MKKKKIKIEVEGWTNDFSYLSPLSVESMLQFKFKKDCLSLKSDHLSL